MHKLIRLSTFVLFLSFSAMEIRAEEPSAKPDSAKEEFNKVHKEFNAVNAELRIMQVEYLNADRAGRNTIEKKWNTEFSKSVEIRERFFKVAEKVFTQSPNADKEMTKLLWMIFGDRVKSDDYETASRLAKLLIDNGNNDTMGFAFAGIAAVSVGDFKSAANYFNKADKAGFYKTKPDPKNKHMENTFVFWKNLGLLEQKWEKEQKIREAEAKDTLPRVLIKTSKGDIRVELFENEAPNTVANFIKLAKENFYDGLTFHRVLPGFMAQGGDPASNGSAKLDYTIPDECRQENHRDHFRGSLSMAKPDQPDSGNSQFFICFAPALHLDGQHTVFGRVIDGFEVLAKIQRRNPEDPNTEDPDKIIKMEVERGMKQEHKLKKTGE